MSDEESSSIRRQQIAEAALTLVADRGLNRLSVAAVVRRVGLVPSGIYRHFKSKEEYPPGGCFTGLGSSPAASSRESRSAGAAPRPVGAAHPDDRGSGCHPRIIFSDAYGGHPDTARPGCGRC